MYLIHRASYLAITSRSQQELTNSCRRSENLLRSVTNCNNALRGKKRIDLFECARVDHTRPIEETIASLKELVEKGLFDHIGLSEASAETLKRANTVYPISATEIEVNAWSVEEETKKGESQLSRLSRGCPTHLHRSPGNRRGAWRSRHRLLVRIVRQDIWLIANIGL